MTGRKPILRIDAHSMLSRIETSSDGARNQSNSSLAKRSQAFDGPMPKKNDALAGNVPPSSLRHLFSASSSSGSAFS